jgi:UDP-N-acetylglucosamine diphosphorylase / glucose-1-phosphate thymidylyltransferase / UDP-N-acetylgalactosamine diphosphorylase / glucosamine-1-phosphate N-acetyltransferase / galactosamine-1-phosphate N-acetyltransferase
MKALVLAAGSATRLSKHLNNYQKCVLRIGDKPVVQYSLDNALAAAVDGIIVVVASLADEIVSLFGDSYNGIPIEYAVQTERRGLVHAMECAAPLLGNHDVMLFLADELMRYPRHAAMAAEFYRERPYVLCGISQQSQFTEIRRTYSVLHHPGSYKIYRLVEKPRVQVNNLQGTGNLIFSNAMLRYLPITPINPVRGERDLTDFIQCAIDDGHAVNWFEVGEDYININEPADIEKIEHIYGMRVSWPTPVAA